MRMREPNSGCHLVVSTRFCTLEDNTEVCYKTTSSYSPAHDAGVVWNDPDLGIKWPIDTGSIILSEKDERLPRLRELPTLFGDKS